MTLDRPPFAAEHAGIIGVLAVHEGQSNARGRPAWPKEPGTRFGLGGPLRTLALMLHTRRMGNHPPARQQSPAILTDGRGLFS